MEEDTISTLSSDEGWRIRCKDKPQVIQLNQMYQYYGSICNYCNKGKSYTWSFTKFNMEPYTYELLMERGWRRCSNYYYKPDLFKSCCQQWTHRMQANRFKIKKNQRKVMRKMLQLVSHKGHQQQKQHKEQKQQHKQQQKQQHKQQHKQQSKYHYSQHKQLKQVDKTVQDISQEHMLYMKEECNIIHGSIESIIMKYIPNLNGKINYDVLQKLRYFRSRGNYRQDYYCNYLMLIYGCNKTVFKQYSLMQFVKILKKHIEEASANKLVRVEVEAGGYLLFYLKEHQNNKDYPMKKEKHKGQTQKKICQEVEARHQDKEQQKQYKHQRKQQYNKQTKPKKRNSNKQIQQEHQEENMKYQSVFSISPDIIRLGQMVIEVVPVQYTEESYQLYKIYCKSIHQKDKQSKDQYKSFLCTKGLNSVQLVAPKSMGSEVAFESYQPRWGIHNKIEKQKGQLKLGCYHMKYRLGGKLIGVGVVDIVPTGLSSVYYFYDPKYKQSRLGVLSSLVQIEYVRYIGLMHQGFKYYYLGFFISNTNKMSYKANYQPYALLCPKTFHFVQINQHLKQYVIHLGKGLLKAVDIRLAHYPLHQDLAFHDAKAYALQHQKLSFNGMKIDLDKMDKNMLKKIINILIVFLSIWGKQLYEIFTISLN